MLFILQSIILGIVQGITEFIPVSSSGHLVLANHFMGFELQDITFEIMLHVGTLFSVIIYFYKDICGLLSALVHYKERSEEKLRDRRVLLYLGTGTIVTGILGFMMKATVERIFYYPLFSAFMLLVTGTIIFISDYITPKQLEMHRTGILRSAIVGVSQAFAILPGISRSGSTIATGMFLGLKREEAARFSFLLSIPAIIGATLFELRSFTGIESHHILGYLLGTVAAFISGYLVIALLLAMIKKRRLKIFSFYVWTVGISVIIVLLFL